MEFLLQKVADEGSSEPYFARLWLGIFELRDKVIELAIPLAERDAFRKSFDDMYDPIMKATSACRDAGKSIASAIASHKQQLNDPEHVRPQKHAIEIPQSIQKSLHDDAAKLLVNGVIAMKKLQALTKFLGVDISPVFVKQHNFEDGIEKLKASGDEALASFLQETRQNWSEKFIKRRSSLEHEGWTLPEVAYNTVGQSVQMIEPTIDDVVLSTYAEKMFRRVVSFTENLLVYSIQHFLPKELSVVEIPAGLRNADRPTRFQIVLRNPSTPDWRITYMEDDFP